MKDWLRLPRWCILSLMLMTVVLSILMLVKVWFPNLIDGELFEKVFLTYLILVVSASLISKMSEYLKKMTGEHSDKNDDK